MTVTSSGPAHRRARWQWPDAYSASIADPPRRPRPVILRSSCGHVLGVGILWRRQRYIAWKRCRY